MDLVEEWKPITGFEGYSVSNHGRIRNDRTERIKVLTTNQQGVMYVGFSRDRVQHIRSVAVLVANAFLDKDLPHFDTPIHLDGNKCNARVDNLRWRPRWFAIRYHNQFKKAPRYRLTQTVELINTGERYAGSFEAATAHGLIESTLVMAVMNGTHVFPTYQEFRLIRV